MSRRSVPRTSSSVRGNAPVGATFVGVGLIVVMLAFQYPAVLGVLGQPLAVTNTVTITNLGVNCNPLNACYATFTIDNINSTTNFAVYLKATNSLYQVVYTNTIQVISSLTTLTPSPLFIGDLQPGGYIFSAFAVSNSGIVLSNTFSQAFNVAGNYRLYFDPIPSSAGSVSVSPQGSSSSCTQSSPCAYPAGSTVTMIFNPQSNYYVGGWIAIGDQGSSPSCTLISGSCLTTTTNSAGIVGTTTNTFSLVMNQNYEVSVSTNNQNIQYVPVEAVLVAPNPCALSSASYVGAVPPLPCPSFGSTTPGVGSTVSVYQYSGFGPTSAQFTATPGANYTFAGWNIWGASTSSKVYANDPITLNYTFLTSPGICGSNGGCGSSNPVWMRAIFTAKQFWPLTIGGYPGITTTPAIKSGGSGYYTYADGATVTVSASGSSGVCFTGWLVDGNSAGSGNSVAVTMNSPHSVYAQGKACSPTTTSSTTTSSTVTVTTTICTSNCNPPPQSHTLNIGEILGGVIAAMGVVIATGGGRRSGMGRRR